MIVELHSSASAELSRQAIWYERQRSGLGLDLLGEVRATIARIQESPRRWPLSPLPKARREGVRRLSLHRFPFSVEYLVFEDIVFVLAIAHMSRRPGYWLRRLSTHR